MQQVSGRSGANARQLYLGDVFSRHESTYVVVELFRTVHITGRLEVLFRGGADAIDISERMLHA